MRSWKVKTVDVLKEVHLDPRNVRLDLESNAPEADIMLDLFQNEKALSLVEGIVKVGYLTHEIPIVVSRARRLIVVEGNRRVAALKAIQNPYLVPDFQSRISALTKGFSGRDQLQKIEVKVAPKQSDADQVVATLHAGSPRVAWTPARQAAFFQTQIDAGQTYKQLRANYPMINVDKYVLRSAILQRFKAVKYPTPELVDFVQGRGLSTSTLARVYESRDFIEFAGLQLGADGELVTSLPTRIFDAVARMIIQGMSDGDINTRSVNTVRSPRFLALMGELRDIAAIHREKPKSKDSRSNASSGGASSSGSTGAERGPVPSVDGSPTGSSGGTGMDPVGQGARPRTARKSLLDVSALVVPVGYPASITRILQEFSTLDVDKYPNAAFDLLRTLLEKTTKSFAEAMKEDIKKSGRNQNGYVFLSDCLKWLESWFVTHGPKSQVQVVKKVQSTKVGNFSGSQDHLNAINHNHHVFASGDDVRNAWDVMRSLIVEMLK